MKRLAVGFLVVGWVWSATILGGCGSDKVNPLTPFQPEIIADANAFQFQATDVSHVSTAVTYSWENTSTRVTVNHSTATTSGQATVHVLDADNIEVYTAGLASSLNETSTAGTAGVWTIRVVFTDFTGTVNFRIEPL